MNITAVERFASIVDGERMSYRMAAFVEQITRQVNHNTAISGNGSPEGVISAEPLKIYIDTTANTIYYKKTGSGATGWQLT